MRLGDTICLAHKARIVDYIDGDTMTIAIQYPSGPIYVQVPIYISNLGIRYAETDFRVPGDYAPFGHPDYYERSQIKDKRARYLHNNREVIIEIGEDFNLNGEYFLIDVETGEETTKYAALRVAEEREGIVKDLMMSGTLLDEEVLSGTAIAIYVRIPQPAEDKIEFYETMEDLLEGISDLDTLNEITDLKVVIHDNGTDAEYELPLLVTKIFISHE